ncbi:uncharacterized protein [Macrobrachium rosenbergii]|uniref:uncharacterized protein isoform X2 n=1 Tax=Macrobrachium rosenbergii TaxID=79674 RepID=UPI0034D41062
MFKLSYLFFLFQTSGSEPVPPEPGSHVYETRKKYCCYCGRRGHYGFECRLARCSYVIQGQSVFSYSTPVVEANGQLLVNLEGAQVRENLTKVEVGRADLHKISGRGGEMINNISRVTGANLCAYEDNGRSYIQVIGDSGAQISSYFALETILGYSLWNPKLSPLMKTMSRNRNKEKIINIVRKKINFYNGLSRRLPELPEAVQVLRKGQRMNGSANSPKFSQRLKEALQLVSLIIIGHLKWGEGQSILQHVTQVLGQIKKLRVKEKVPLPILEDIACKLQKIDSPHIGQLNDILKLAEKYLKNTKHEEVLHASKIQRPVNNIVDDDVIVLCENVSVANSKVNIEHQSENLINECGSSSSNAVGGFGNEKSVILSKRIEQTEDIELIHDTGNEKLRSSSAKNSLPKAGVIRGSTSGLIDLLSLGDKCQEMNNCGQMKRSSGVNAELENEVPAVGKYESFTNGGNERFLTDEAEKLTVDFGTGSLKGDNSGLEGVPYFVHKRPESSDCGGNDSLRYSLSSALRALAQIRTRESVLEILQRTVVYCNSMQSKLPELHDAVSILKERQKFDFMTKSSPRGFQKKLKTALKLASLLMLGHPKDGEVYHKISELLSQVWMLNSEVHVPEFIIKEIKNSLRKMSNPSVKKLDYLIALADKYVTSESYVGEGNTRMQKCLRADQDQVGSSSVMKTLGSEKDDKRVTFGIAVDDAREMIAKQLLMSTKKRRKCSSKKGAKVNTIKYVERAVLEESMDLASMEKLFPLKRKKGNSIKNGGKQKCIRKLNPKKGTVLEKDLPICVEKVLPPSKGKQNKAKNTKHQAPFTSQRCKGLRKSSEVEMPSTLGKSLKPKNKVKNFSVTRKGKSSKGTEGSSVKGVCGKQINKKVKVRETDVDSSGLKYPKAKKKRKVISSKLKPKFALF